MFHFPLVSQLSQEREPDDSTKSQGTTTEATAIAVEQPTNNKGFLMKGVALKEFEK